jgi:8-oxo-dGTP pyrophosphatase MutT (NUDIX family)
MPKDIKSVSKVIVKWKNKCLMLQRADNKQWELPGGHLNVSESFRKGAKREVYEETGLKISKLSIVLQQRDFCLYTAKPRVIKVRLSREHVDYKWVRVKELSKLNVSKSTMINMRSILKSVD